MGRPKAYTDLEVMQAKIVEYFDFCDNRIQKIYSAKSDGVIEVNNPAPYGVEGLSAYLEITRKTLAEYEKEPEFCNTIKKAKQRIAGDVENRLMDGKNAAGPIFNLKNNFGWKDKQETTTTHKYEDMTEEEIDARLDTLRKKRDACLRRDKGKETEPKQD